MVHLLVTAIPLLGIAISDWRTLRIPDWALWWLGIWALLWQFVMWRSLLSWELALAVLIGAGFFGVQYLMSHGRWIGSGDIVLGGIMGLLLGWPGVLIGIVASYVLGAVVMLSLIAFGKRTRKQQVPLGTFLAIGMYGVLVLL